MTSPHFKILIALCFSLSLTGQTAQAQMDEAQVGSEIESPTIHQRASICWEDPEKIFEDEPIECSTVCNTCHTYAVVVEGQSENPEALTTDETYADGVENIPGQEVTWDSLGVHQQSCRDCHTDITDPDDDTHTIRDDSHPIFFEYDAGPVGIFEGYGSGNFKPTSLPTYSSETYNSIVLCTTCHAPHRDDRGLLKMPNTLSQLCRDCHNI